MNEENQTDTYVKLSPHLQGANLDLRLSGLVEVVPLSKFVLPDGLIFGAELYLYVKASLLPDDLALLLVRKFHHQRQQELALLANTTKGTPRYDEGEWKRVFNVGI